MGIFDNANDLLDRETARMGKVVKAASLKSQLKELRKQRTAAMARLGEAVYPQIKDDASFRGAFKALLDCIEDIDRQINGFQYDIAALDRRDALIASELICLNCGQTISENDQFCPNCGSRVENAVSAGANGEHCPRCGTVAEEGHAFCVECGSKISSL